MKISVRLYHGFSLINHKGRDFLVWFQLPKYKASISTTVEEPTKVNLRVRHFGECCLQFALKHILCLLSVRNIILPGV